VSFTCLLLFKKQIINKKEMESREMRWEGRQDQLNRKPGLEREREGN
jgi:hypothetical protein